MKDLSDWPQLHARILQLEQAGRVTRTFRRLDPDRQQAVLTAILDEAAEKGPAAISIKEIADRAGVAVGSLYAYFGSRDGLLDFAIDLCVHLMNDTFNTYRSYLAALPLREALRAYLMGGVEWGQTQVGLIRFFARAAYQGDPMLTQRVVQPVGETMLGIVREILAAAVARGEVRPDVDLDAAARLVHGLTIVIGDSQLFPYLNVYFQAVDSAMPVERILATLDTLVFRGIGKEETQDA